MLPKVPDLTGLISQFRRCLHRADLPGRSAADRRRRRSTAAQTEFLEERLVLDVSAPAILQIFESTYDNIEDRSGDIFAAGYGGVWVPPTGRADSGNQSVGYDVFDRFDLGSPGAPTLYGTETGLKTSVDVLHNAGVQVYVDFILNHNGFSDASTPGFVDAGGYPGFAVTLPGDVDGDFNGAFETGDIDMRLSGLIDIDQNKNHQFIRHPTDPNNVSNIPAGTINNVAKPENARFYPDRDLTPITLSNGSSSFDVYPFNTSDPTAGDPTLENAMGLLMRNAQWMVQEIGVDGFRLDAAKHFENFVLDFFDQAVYRSNLNPQLDGSTQHVFSFSEVFDGDLAFQQSKIRKDIDPGDPGKIGGNRDVLDFPLFFAMNANLTGDGTINDWRNIKNASQDVQDDGLANNGSQGVGFVNSHDEHGAFLNNVAHAYVLMRPGNAVVYFNAEEFGQGRDFPKDGRGDALGGQFGDAITKLVEIRNTHGRGDYIDRTPGADEKEMLIFERSASALTVLSNRLDADGSVWFDSRTVQTNFLPGTPLIELTGNAANPIIDPDNSFPEVLVVNSDGTVNLRVPRNRSKDGVQHNSGYFVYGASGPQGTLSLAQSTAINTIPAENATTQTNGTSRISGIDVITDDEFTVILDTVAVNHLGSIRDQFADGDNALLRIDGGIDVNGNGNVDFTAVGNTSYGFEEFVTLKFPGFAQPDGLGAYAQTIDTTLLAEGRHFIEVRAFRHREPGEGDAIYSTFKQPIYVDRLAPVSEVASFDPLVQGVNENRQLRIRSTDLTADNVHTFMDLPAALTDAEIIAMLDGTSQTNKLDRELFSNDYNGLTSGNHVATVVTFEISGNVNVQRISGLNVSSIFGAGLGDLDFDGDIDGADIAEFDALMQTNNTQFNPAGDFDADGVITVVDLSLYHQQLLGLGVDAPTMDFFEQVVDVNASLDYGDADTPPPSSYPSARSVDGARHILNAGPFLGSVVDAEPDAYAGELADGDDTTDTDDEDGVTLPNRFLAGRTVSIDVEASGDGLLNAFFDFNADGDWIDAGEQIATNLPLTTGTNSVSVSVPVNAAIGDTYARFRFDTFGNLGPDDLGSNGEVEDYIVQIDGAQSRIVDDTQATATLDGTVSAGSMEYIGPTPGVGDSFGGIIGDGTRLFVDSSGTGTLSFGVQPSTAIEGGSGSDVIVVYIDNGSGTGVTSTDAIADYFGPSEQAISGDASAAAGDESDLTFATGFTASHAITVEGGFIGLWTIANNGSLNLIAGRTNDGSFDLGTFNFQSAVDQVNGLGREWDFDLAAIGLSPGDSFRYFATLIGSAAGFRSSEFSGVDSTTIATLPADPHIGTNSFTLLPSDFSEFVTVPPPLDYGDAPATTLFAPPTGGYRVTIAEDGARHFAVGPTLGPLRDVEDDGQHHADALGDNNADSDDEDGISFHADSLVISELGTRSGTVDIDLQNPDGTANFVDAWIDFNQNGRFSDPGEQILSSLDLGTTAGTQTVNFTIPQYPGTNGYFGDTFSRFRLSTTGGLTPLGSAADGEVEDHKLTILGELRLSIDKNSIKENSDFATATLTRFRGGAALSVTVSNVLNEVIFEESLGSGATSTITIPAGMTSTTFVISGVDNAILDGTRTETISAAAAGFSDASVTLDVTDDDQLPTVTLSVADAEIPEESLFELADLLIPAYSNPCCDDGPEFWANLIAAAPNTDMTVILNPASGPGASPIDPNYINDTGSGPFGPVLDLKAAGGKIIGYVATTYGNRDIAQVMADIDTYYTAAYWRGAGVQVDGIFFDEMSNDLADVGYYETLRDHVRSKAAAQSVVGNPGTTFTTDSSSGASGFTVTDYANAADVLVTFENSATEYRNNYTPPSWVNDFSADHFAHMIHSESLIADVFNDITLASSRNAGWLFVSSDVLPNPYDNVSSYWTSETTFTATLSETYGEDVTVSLSFAGTAAAADYTAAASIVIPAGQLSASTTVDAASDSLNETSETVTVEIVSADNARIIGTQQQTTTIIDNDPAALSVAITAASFSEAGGNSATTATVTRNTDTTNSLTVTLSSSDTSEATVPATVTIPAGETTSAPFSIDAVDDPAVDGSQTVTISATAAAHADGAATVEVEDDDVAGYTVSETGEGTTVAESRTADTFTVVLNAQPLSNVVFNVLSFDTSEVTVDRTALIFTPSDWITAQTVTVRGVNDNIVDGDQTTQVRIALDPAASDDRFDSVGDRAVFVITTDDDTAGFSVSETGSTIVTEAGSIDEIEVVLQAQPVTDVVLTVTSDDTGEATVDKTTLTFNSGNWSIAQTVNITGVDDNIVDGDQSTTITISVDDNASDDVFDPLADQTVSVTTTDDDVAGFTITETGGAISVAETGTADTFDVVLDRQPLTNVVITVTSDDTGEAVVDLAALTFTPADWDTAQTITVTGIDDPTVDGDQTTSITLSVDDGNSDNAFDPLPDQTVSVTTTDDDTAGFTINESGGATSVAETGTADTFDVVLDRQPLTNVVITIVSGDTGEAVVDLAALTFTPADWDTAQTITVTGVDDATIDGDQTTTITLSIDPANSDDAFDALTNQTVTVTTVDDGIQPTLTLTIDESSVSENGGFATGTLTRSHGTDELPVDVASLLGDGTFERIDAPGSTVLLLPNSGALGDPNRCRVCADIGLDPSTGEAVIVGYSDDGNSDSMATIFAIPSTRDSTSFQELIGLGPRTLVAGISPDAVRIAGVSQSPGSFGIGEGTTWLRSQLGNPVGIGFDPTQNRSSAAIAAWSDGVVGDVGGIAEAARWSADAGLVNLLDDGGLAQANDVSADGGITVGFQSALPWGVFWNATGIHYLPLDTANFAVVRAISPNGRFMGGGTDFLELEPFDAGQQAVVWDGPGFDFRRLVNADGSRFRGEVQDISDSGYAVGYTEDQKGFIWHETFDGIRSPFNGPQLFEDWLSQIPGGQALPTPTTNVPGIAEDAENGMLLFAVQGTGEAYFVQASIPRIMTTDTVTIPEGQTSVTFRINAADNFILDGNRSETISVSASGFVGASESLGIADDDVAGFRVREFGPDTTASEAGTTDIFDIVLDAQPASDVTITVTNGDPGETSIDKTTLTFTPTNWNIGQLVTVTGVNDDIDDDDQTTTISVSIDAANSDDDFDLLPNQAISVTTTDDDARGITVSATSGDTTEAGGTATFTVVLNTMPTADVTIAVSSDNTAEGTVSPASLTFTTSDWDSPQTVTVTGVDDSVGDGNVSFNIVLDPAVGGDYAGIDPPDVVVVNQDDEGPFLDVDGNSAADAATDGILIIRYLFGFRGAPLISGAIGAGATNTTATEIEAALDNSLATLDADGNGVRDAATDGILIIRYLFGFRDAPLVSGAIGSGATRTTGPEVAAFLNGFLPPPPSPPVVALTSPEVIPVLPRVGSEEIVGAADTNGAGTVAASFSMPPDINRERDLFDSDEEDVVNPLYIPDEDYEFVEAHFGETRGWLDAL